MSFFIYGIFRYTLAKPGSQRSQGRNGIRRAAPDTAVMA